MNNIAINCLALSKNYGKKAALKELSLEITSGAFYGFLGPNGAGKSTTIRSLLGLIATSGGKVSVLGLDPSDKKERTRLLAQVGYLPSETQFYPGMKVSEVIDLSARLQRKDCKAEAERLCQRLNLDISRKVDELSLGNRKKVGIVCAMQHDPKLYILDEPTSGLDPLIQQTFFELLEEKHKLGKTIFFSSHVLSEVQEHCTRAAILREGALVAEGTVEELIGSNAKRVHLLLQSTAVLPDKLISLPGISHQKQRGEKIDFLYSGAPGLLLEALSHFPENALQDLTITEPGLDDVFLHYYKGEQ